MEGVKNENQKKSKDIGIWILRYKWENLHIPARRRSKNMKPGNQKLIENNSIILMKLLLLRSRFWKVMIEKKNH